MMVQGGIYGSDLLQNGYPNLYSRKIGDKQYSIKDHLGNVRVTFADKKIPANGLLQDFVLETQSVSTYYPFGWEVKPLSWAFDTYRFGYNNKEKDGDLGALDYGFRIYSPRVARFLSVDPLTKGFPMLTPFQFASNQPVWAIDLEGLERKIVIHYTEGIYANDDPKITKTTVDILQNKIIQDPTTGKNSAVTYVFYYDLKTNSLTEGQTLYENFDELDGMKPSAAYDYTQNVIPGKFSDDWGYIGWKLWRGARIVDRDFNAPDNNLTLEDVSAVDGAMTIPPFVIGTFKKPSVLLRGQSKKGMKKVDYLFKNRGEAMNFGLSKLGKNVKKVYNKRGQLVKYENSAGDYLHFNHGDWGKGKGTSTFPHINYKFGSTKGHLFLADKIVNRNQLDDFLKWYIKATIKK